MKALAVLGHQCHRRHRECRASFAPMKAREGLTRHAEDLECTADPLLVVGREPRRRLRITDPQHFVHGGPAEFFRLFGDACPNLRRRRRHFVYPLAKRFGVKHGSAHNERNPSSSLDFVHKPCAVRHEVCGAVGFVDLTDIDEMVRRCPEFFLCWLSAPDIHPPVDQSRVNRNDFHGVLFRELQGQRGLSGCRGSEQKQSNRLFRHQRPLMKRRSSSSMESAVQVGRPWLH